MLTFSGFLWHFCVFGLLFQSSMSSGSFLSCRLLLPVHPHRDRVDCQRDPLRVQAQPEPQVARARERQAREERGHPALPVGPAGVWRGQPDADGQAADTLPAARPHTRARPVLRDDCPVYRPEQASS